ncbi:MAG TPA: SMP-30/gluconolactonase/LRE family protein [Pedobacter sp.]|nr:SMP-30/gluconolactonase/LRE family protein [Pedobacter sp.]
MKVSNVLEHTALLGEGPIWDHRSGTIIWVDILRSQVMQFNPETKAFQISNVGKNISALAIRKDGGFVAAARNGFGWLDLKKPSFTYVSQPEIELQNNRFNDGKCDPRGRFWAGSMDCKDGKTLCGSLYSIDSKLSPLIKIEHVGCSNGLAWSPDCAIFYYIDTPTRQVVAYDYNITDSSISNKRTVIVIPDEEGLPDGMTIDTDGMLWIACWNGWSVSKWDPYTGNFLSSIRLPVSQVSSCTFGGPNLRDLYISSARVGLNRLELRQQPLAGSLFVVKDCDAKGIQAFEFNG